MPPLPDCRPVLAACCLLLALLVAVPALAEHGAVATGPDERFGWSRDFRTQGQADRKALEECGRRCRILFQFKDSCAAYATGRAGAAGWEISNSETPARDMALERCRRHSRDCRLRMSACS
jgi:hypothetical protein